MGGGGSMEKMQENTRVAPEMSLALWEHSLPFSLRKCEKKPLQ